MKANYRPVILLKLVISVCLFALVVWQTYKCIAKFNSGPQSTLISYQRIAQVDKPTITICPALIPESSYTSSYKADIVKSLGYKYPFRWHKLYDLKRIINRNLNMTYDTMELLNLLTYPLSELVNIASVDISTSERAHYVHARISRLNETSVGIQSEIGLWRKAYNGEYGKCYWIDYDDSVKKGKLNKISFLFRHGVHLFVHEPGQRRSKKLTFISRAENLTYQWYRMEMRYKVVQLLNFGGEENPCMKESLSFDMCHYKVIGSQLVRKVNCTTPIPGPVSKVYPVCQDAKAGIAAEKAYRKAKEFSDELEKRCLQPCTYMDVSVRSFKKVKKAKKIKGTYIEFVFDDMVEVLQLLNYAHWFKKKILELMTF